MTTKDPLNEPTPISNANDQSLGAGLEGLTLPPHRRHLPDTRPSLVHKFSVTGFEGYLIVGYFEDGSPGEVFIKMAKEGSTLAGFCDAVGVLTSIALQHGVPLETITDKLKNTRFEPSGLTTNSQLPEATSLCDYIARWLELVFAPDATLPQPTTDTPSPDPTNNDTSN